MTEEVTAVAKALIALFLPILLYILAGYYASNARWCSRKIIVAAIVGLCIGIYGLSEGIEITNSWVDVAFNSGEAMGAMYLIDRIVKGFAKRNGINWLYSDDPVGEENTEVTE